MDIYELRQNFMSEALDESDIINSNPFDLFRKWYDQANLAKIYEPNAFALATVSKEGKPSARMLLLKDFSSKGFTFFTNYESRKARELNENNNAAMVFFWSELERQVRICGEVRKISDIESDAYFHTRPTGSRLGAWASPQSTVIASRTWLLDQHNDFRKKYKDGEIPRPKNWGGYILSPESIEFWQGRVNRLHDRIEFVSNNEGWFTRRLAP